MADPLVIHDDLELFLTGWFRAALAARPEPVCRNVSVTNVEPEPGEVFPEKLLVIRDNGGPDTSLISAERDIGLSILAGTKDNPKDANDLARIVHALRSQIPAIAAGNPVAAIIASNGPYPVPENRPTARRYLTMTLVVVGALL
ncbi:hypothetical protein E3O55_08490 [Cryobacterium sp. MDB1-18-2]|uniref:hypothetical protein n=1 Tax=unclassified Cryobacterium TaxID=2649013 RepID=UPI00106A4BC1|nr:MULTISPECIES: hypothetical protein [unclassified Cryobacterium]TFC30111.1 hypothetical protein E3O55_08490 [Cryobacterium sp. MDB1-18-2]TFC41391.1 hypothetical protein E3O50_09930 [Cryobacterium sp. MDB1-18-1]